MEKDEKIKSSDEIKNFDDLIEEVRGSKDVDKEKLEKWKTAFHRFWKNDGDGNSWKKLISLLPVPQNKFRSGEIGI
jgi:hypothetical protein